MYVSVLALLVVKFDARVKYPVEVASVTDDLLRRVSLWYETCVWGSSFKRENLTKIWRNGEDKIFKIQASWPTDIVKNRWYFMITTSCKVVAVWFDKEASNYSHRCENH